MHPWSTLRNLAARLGAPVARALRVPSISATATRQAYIAVVNVTDDLDFFVLEAYCLLTLKNKAPIDTSVTVAGFEVLPFVAKFDSALLEEGRRWSRITAKNSLDLKGGKTLDAVVMARVHIREKPVDGWPKKAEGKLQLAETYDTKITAVSLPLEFSEDRQVTNISF